MQRADWTGRTGRVAHRHKQRPRANHNMHNHPGSGAQTTLRLVTAPITALILALVSFVALGPPAQAEAQALDQQPARYEVRFMTTTIDHHEMAIQMSQISLDKPVHPELETMCSQVIASSSRDRDHAGLARRLVRRHPRTHDDHR
jgi:uncharacterized protein (DUF305 family)